ncbi:MAG: Ppx/GppA family phosphatase [Actinobacteria bacterium]|nr:Ppx/GppA family phosphatase [Actinomycetota bacterium]
MRVAVVDIGTNSTRLLIADVAPDGALTQLKRESLVTRLGHRVDANGRLGDEAMERVFDTLTHFKEQIDGRDASNGQDFTEQVRERFGIDARTIDGDEEAALTFAGATSERPNDDAEIVVVDIGGGSTEFVVGRHADEIAFHVSTQAGVVRQTERHLHDDPPPPEGVRRLAQEAQEIFIDAIPLQLRERVNAAIAVAGTATTCAAIELELEPYEPERVHGHTLELGTCELLLARLAQMTDGERRQVPGLHPDRAPTIVAGVAMLIEVLRAFGLEQVEVSEHDILRGAALRLAARSPAGGI